MDGTKVVARTVGRALGEGALLGACVGSAVWLVLVVLFTVFKPALLGYIILTPIATGIGACVGLALAIVTSIAVGPYIATRRRHADPATVADGIVPACIVSVEAVVTVLMVFGAKQGSGVFGAYAVLALLAFPCAMVGGRHLAETYLRAEQRTTASVER